MNAPSLGGALALSPVTIPQCTFEDGFRLAAEAGFTGIGLRYNRLEEYLAAGHGLLGRTDLARALRTALH